MSSLHPPADKTSVQYSQYQRYFCHICKEECINHRDAARTKYSECAGCFSVPALEEADDQDADDLDDRQADDLVCGPGQERPEDGRKPGTAVGRARNSGSAERDRPRSGGSVSSAITSTAIGDAADRLAYRRSSD